MNVLPRRDSTLNIRYNAPAELWQKIPSIYEQISGWLGFGKDGIPSQSWVLRLEIQDGFV